MPQPSYIGSGVVPQTGDTQLILLAKILGSVQNLAGALPENDPKPWDLRRMLLFKLLRALQNIGVSDPANDPHYDDTPYDLLVKILGSLQHMPGADPENGHICCGFDTQYVLWRKILQAFADTSFDVNQIVLGGEGGASILGGEGVADQMICGQ